MKKQQIKATISAVVLGVLSPLVMVVPASALTRTWNGSVDGLFSNASNWDTAPPSNGDTVEFPATSNYDFESATFRVSDNDLTSLSLAKVIFNGAVSLSSTSFNITGSGFTLTESIEAVMTGNGGDHFVDTSVTLGADATFKTTGSNSLSVGDGVTVLDLGANDLTLDASGGSVSLMGKITGTGNIIKAGTGKVNIYTTLGTGGFSGGLTVPTGEVNAVGSLGNVTLTGGTLKGTGTVGVVTMSSGTVAPGASPGVLNTGNLVFTGGTHAVELGGKAAGEFDQLNVTGTVALGSETTLSLSLVNSFAPAVNDSFVIIANDADDAVTGTFKGMADGSKVTLGSYTYQINYDGGTGNDVVLLVTGTPSAPDTGVGTLLSSPVMTFIATLLVAGVVVGYRVYEVKKAKN